MPKMKSHRSSRKRFRVTASGLLRRHQAGKRHLLSHKSGRRKRHLRSPFLKQTAIAKTYVTLLGGDFR
jgi:large subunit ribosomal protein L35